MRQIFAERFVACLAAWAVCICAAACSGGSGPGSDGGDPPGTQEPPSNDPPPNNNDGGEVTIEGTGQSFPTLQEAVDAASHGDVLELAPGIYRESITMTRALTLRSRDGPTRTFLDGDDADRILSIGTHVAGRTVRLEGLTLRFGNADPGGAILMTAAELECENCVFDRCSSSDRAGAVAVRSTFGSAATSARFDACVFRECSSDARGGAVFLTAGSGDSRVVAHFHRCRFERNRGNQGGAVFASVGAGDARVDASFDRCVFQDNTGKDGGAILAESGSGETTIRLDILGCLFVRNIVSGEGSAVRARALAGSSGVEVRIVHSTIAGNSAPNLPGSRAAVAVSRGAASGSVRLDLHNSILWDNSPRQLDASGIDRMLLNNIVSGGVPEPSNLDLDPLFLFPAGDNYLPGPESPAVDAGDPQLVPIELSEDLAGTPRVSGEAPDMGAFERE